MATSNADAISQPVDVLVDDETLCLVFANGERLQLPLSYSPRLQAATPAQRQNWQWIGRRSGIHWPDVDEDLSVSGIARDAGLAKKALTKVA